MSVDQELSSIRDQVYAKQRLLETEKDKYKRDKLAREVGDLLKQEGQLSNQGAEIKKQGILDRQRAEISREAIAGDTAAGIEFAKTNLGMGEGSLGRQKKVSQVDTRRLKDLSKGMGAKELQANRDKALENINRSTQLQNRRLQAIQSQQGVRGATAGSQQLSILQSGEKQKADFERDLFLQDRQARIEGLQNLTEAQRYNQEQLMAQEKFNLAQAAQEKYDLAQAGLAFAGLGAQERAGERAKEAQEAAAAAGSGCFAEGTLILMANGTTKPIEEVNIGDITSGGVVYSLVQAANDSTAFLYKGVRVTGTHAVKHEGEFVRVGDIPDLDKVGNVYKVYSFSNKHHNLVVISPTGEKITFADYDECYDVDLAGEERLAILNG